MVRRQWCPFARCDENGSFIEASNESFTGGLIIRDAGEVAKLKSECQGAITDDFAFFVYTDLAGDVDRLPAGRGDDVGPTDGWPG